MAAKAVVRDVGRVQGFQYGFVDRIAKLIPFEIGMTLTKALEVEEDLQALYDSDDEVQGLIDMALKLEGMARNAGKHAGGVVIAPSKLTDFTPLYCEQGSTSIVTQFDKNDVEAVGLVKFDFLGLRTLTIIDWAVKTINEKRDKNKKELFDISLIPMDDPPVFELLKRCATTAVFQLESRGMKDLIKRLQPDSFDDIVALVALFRPGPLQSGMVDDFIDRKHGRAQIEYPHPALEHVLKPTYGVILYQEQVMQIAQELALYTLGGADLLRRAMGKKKPEEMAKQRSIFVDGAKKNDVENSTSMYIFDLMEKFAGYGFNKSHSAAYALVAYQTAYLKAHYPAEFMAAVLSSDMDNTDKIVNLVEECRDMRLHVVPPNINISTYRFTVGDEPGTIIYGLGAIKGVGEAAIESMLEERIENGEFEDLFDFCRRVDLRKVNRRVIEALVRAGAMDGLASNRATLMGTLSDALKAAEQFALNSSTGMQDLFGEKIDSSSEMIPQKEFKDWDDETRLTGEKETLGLYLTGHPIERYEQELEKLTSGRIVELVGDTQLSDNPVEGIEEQLMIDRGAMIDKQVVVAGLAIGVRVINTRRGRMAIVTLDDRTARIDATLFSDVYEAYGQQIIKDQVLVLTGKLGLDSFTGGLRLTTDKVYSLEDARTHFGNRLIIRLNGYHQKHKKSKEIVQSLASTLLPFRSGDCPVWVDYHTDSAHAQLPLGEKWKVTPSDELMNRIKEILGKQSVWVEYKAGARALE
jgi:DNA polymerase-3 subunit alpha